MNEDLSWSGVYYASKCHRIQLVSLFSNHFTRFLSSMTLSIKLIENLSLSDARDLLRKWRDDNERKSGELMIKNVQYVEN